MDSLELGNGLNRAKTIRQGGAMIELAEWGGLTYYMFKEESPTKHIVLVRDSKGNKAAFSLENCEEIKLDTFQKLDPLSIGHAKRMIETFRKDFLEYWQNVKQKANL